MSPWNMALLGPGTGLDMADDDLLVFEDEPGADPNADSAGKDSTKGMPIPWRILVVDDDEEVHRATSYALRDAEVLGRPLELLAARSAREALGILRHEADIAVVLLDVVMEDDQAGLRLVKVIRKELDNRNVRIVLRTGQPGYAPEEEAIRDYDINDYKNKSELTQTRLLTTITAAVRSWVDICSLEQSRRDLERIVEASSQLMPIRQVVRFATLVGRQIGEIFSLSGDWLVLSTLTDRDGGVTGSTPAGPLRVIAATGEFSPQLETTLETLSTADLKEHLQEVRKRRQSLLGRGALTMYCRTGSGTELLAYHEGSSRYSEEHVRSSLGVYASTVGLSLENVALMARLKYFAYYDSLLDIPNRMHFVERVDQRRELNIQACNLIVCDLDQFSAINDTMGSHYGDELLRRVRDRLLEELGDKVIVGRLSGDTFGLLGPDDAVNTQRVREIFARPFVVYEHEDLLLSVTQGYVRLPAGSDVNAHEAIKRASIALKRAKELYRGEECEFTGDMARQTKDRVRLLHNLRHAFEAQNLFLAYQPQIDMRDGSVTGLEALMRWKTAEGKMIPPDQFIHVAENSGMIVALGDWAMREAMGELRRLQDTYQREFLMGLNVSVVQFRHPKFLDMLDRALADTGVKPESIELEVTESVAMLDMAKVGKVLVALRERGCKIAIDDFGTGFSSLSYLEHLPIHRLKIDKSFVNKLDTGLGESNLPELIIQLSRNLNLEIIAEGVETEQQVRELLRLGCDQAQGYFYARPMPLKELHVWLDDRLQREPRPVRPT